MTKKKPRETEVVDGAGATAGLILVINRRSASGYYGVGKNGKKWQARVYKPAKQNWDDVGSYDSPREAAIAAAFAKKQTEAGLGSMYSPLKPRPKKGAHTAHCPRALACYPAHCQLGERKP